MFQDDEERDEATLRALIDKAIGRSDLAVEIITTGRWELSAQIADRFASDRVFLAGDAAHTLPPSRGGFGANTGIADAHNLAWKLSAVLSGASTTRLLESYDAERRPIAWLRHQQILARPDYKAQGSAQGTMCPSSRTTRWSSVSSTGRPRCSAPGRTCRRPCRPDQWAGQPGTRAPHVPLARRGARARRWTVFQKVWVLLADDDAWSVRRGARHRAARDRREARAYRRR